MLRDENLPFSDIDLMIIEFNMKQAWNSFRIRFDMDNAVDPEGRQVHDVMIIQTEKVNGKVFSKAQLIEKAKNIFEDVMSKGFIFRFYPMPYVQIKKELPKFLLLEDPYNSLSGRIFIFRTHFPRHIYEINREEKDSWTIEAEGVKYEILIHEEVDEQPLFDLTHLKEAVTWYHFSKGRDVQ